MVESKSNRFGGVAGVMLGALVALGLAACATPTQTSSSGSGEVVRDVLVEREGDATLITLMGVEDAVFTAFEQPDGDGVLVDLTDVSAADISGPIVVGDGLVDEIELSAFGSGDGEPMTRVSISVVKSADFEVTPSSDGLRIRLQASGSGPATQTAQADTMDGPATDSLEPSDPWATEAGEGWNAPGTTTSMASLDADPWGTGAGASDPMSADAEPAPAALGDSMADSAATAPLAPMSPVAGKPATTLSWVEANEVGDGLLIQLGADGSIEAAQTFTLESPDRLVIDLPGMKSEVRDGTTQVGSAWADRIRVGQHDDKVRVVVDGGSAAQPFEGRRVAPGAAGLWIALGSGEPLDAAFEASTSMANTAALASRSDTSGSGASSAGSAGGSDAAPAAAADGIATVYGVEFDPQAEKDRIVVMADQATDYLVYEPDPETVVLSISNAVIETDAQVRIAPEVPGPVSLVTAFPQPDVKISEVRVVMQRAANLKPEISRRGSLLVVDFPRTGDVAARPPVMDLPPGEQILTGGGDPMLASATTGGIDLAGDSPASMGAAGGSPGPASLEPPAAIDLLQEGGLIDGKEYSGRRISLDFKDVDIADVLRLIAEVSDLNVIAGDEVRGKVTIRLVDVPWDQALDIILLTKGLGFMRIGNVLRIAPNDVIAQEEEARLQERRAKERLEDLVVKLQPVNYADANDIKAMVKELLTERGTVNVDTRTNTLVLKDIPSVIDEATALVKAIDTQTPQVMIEAKIVEARLQFSREFGSVWSVGVQPLSDAWDDASPLRQDIGSNFMRLRPSQLPGAAGATNGAVFANPITNLPTAVANVGAFLLDEKINLDVQLQAAEVNGDGKVISSPRVVTMDNSKAKIEQGVSIPFQTFENGDAQLEFVDAVLKLDVTPHITANQSIIMEVNVTRNAPDDSVFTLTGSPAIAKNEVDTETLVKDGQTLVLGGIYVVNKSKRQSRVPYLHRIPILGGAFKNNEISDDRQELLIFVTPRIVQVDQAGI